ncbi:MAG: hypothetical protein KKF44_05770 [Nanoarchaeota archaeon]|nr:hypothetical protein [Nanoarchaeota archaeon]
MLLLLRPLLPFSFLNISEGKVYSKFYKENKDYDKKKLKDIVKKFNKRAFYYFMGLIPRSSAANTNHKGITEI